MAEEVADGRQFSKRWGPCLHVVVDRHFFFFKEREASKSTEDVGIRSENLAVTARVRPLLHYFCPSYPKFDIVIQRQVRFVPVIDNRFGLDRDSVLISVGDASGIVERKMPKSFLFTNRRYNASPIPPTGKFMESFITNCLDYLINHH